MHRKWHVTLVVCLGVFMASLDLLVVNIAFPSIQRDFDGTSLSALSWVLNGYAIVFAALLVPAGRWSDEIGRKRAFLSGLAVFVAASAACAAAPSFGVLVAARVVQAIGAALVLPTSLGLMLPEFEPRERGTAIGVWAATSGVAAAAGPPLGGLLVEADWRWVFLINVPVGIVGLALGARRLTERADPGAMRPDVAGAAGFALAVAAIVVAIVQGGGWSWGYGVGALLLLAVARRTRRHPSPLVDPELLRLGSFRLAVVANALFFAGFRPVLLAGVLLLTDVWGESVVVAGLMLAPAPLVAMGLSVRASGLAARYGPRRACVAGAALFALGPLFWIAMAGDDPAYLARYLPGTLLTGAGLGVLLPVLTGLGTSELPPTRFSTGVAVLTMGRQVGTAVGVAVLVAVLGTAVVSDAGDLHTAWLLTSLASLFTGLLVALFGPRRPGVASVAPHAS